MAAASSSSSSSSISSSENQIPSNESAYLKALISTYSNQLWNRLISFLPSRDSNLLTRISTNLHFPTSRRRKSGLPLPLPSRTSLESSSQIPKETSRVFDTLEDILEHTLLNLHDVRKSLRFWQSRGEGTDARKIYFMVFERGLRAFIDETVQLLRGYATEGTPIQRLCHSAAVMISERISALTHLQRCLATFLAQIYMEVDKFGEALAKDPDQSLLSLLVTINELFSKLEASIGHPHEIYKSQYCAFVDGSATFSLHFDKLAEINEERSKWTDCEIIDSINMIYQNLDRLDSYLSHLVARYRKPRRLTLYWLHYTCGAAGLSVCSMWLLRHSSLMGSSDIDNWIHEAKASTVSFWEDHVEQPLLSIRDELFETFKRRHKGVMETEEVQLTADSLHRMLLAFSEQTKGQKFPENASDQEMLKIVMGRYEKELMHPIQNLLGGELARAMLIQIQKLKLEIETAMLELDQILRANEINFAILAALPAFFLSLILLMLVRAWVKQDKGAEGKGRTARLKRRLLVVEVEKRIMQFQNCLDQGQDEDAQCSFGLVLYSLDRLYKTVKRHAKETGEWPSLQQDIIDLAKPGLSTSYKLIMTSRMDRVYDCLLPSTKGR